MAKRSLDDSTAGADAGRELEKVKKKQRKESIPNLLVAGHANENSNDHPEGIVTPGNETSIGEVPKAKLSKAERRALKQARKEQAEGNKTTPSDAPIKDSGYSSPATKEERRALKRALKGALKADKASRKADAAVENNDGTIDPKVTSDSVLKPELPLSATYQEHEELTALSQDVIDTFVAARLLSVEDTLEQSYRPIVSFKYLPVREEAERAAFANFTTPTPIQAACWPYLFAGRDVVGVAETGSGKTLAFGVPCIQYVSGLASRETRGIRACIVSPTRELAMQIHEQLVKLAKPAGLQATCVYGGVSKDIQRDTLSGTHILVATPGRLNDFIHEGSIDLSGVKYLVLDEADRMLDKGFEEDVRKLISYTPSAGRQTLMFTATWPESVRNLASTFMDKPVKITVGRSAPGELRANERIEQEVEVVAEYDKQGRLIQLLKQYQSGKNKNDRILVFCLYKKEATRIEEFIRRKGFRVAGIHGDLSQQKRTESLDAFRQGRVPLLVATDVAARGLDIAAVKLVINVTFPLTIEDYVHRIGRTGRAGHAGKAITMFTVSDKALAGPLINVLKTSNKTIPEELFKFGTTVKKKAHAAYGAFYKDLGEGEMKKATKITFD